VTEGSSACVMGLARRFAQVSEEEAATRQVTLIGGGRPKSEGLRELAQAASAEAVAGRLHPLIGIHPPAHPCPSGGPCRPGGFARASWRTAPTTSAPCASCGPDLFAPATLAQALDDAEAVLHLAPGADLWLPPRAAGAGRRHRLVGHVHRPTGLPSLPIPSAGLGPTAAALVAPQTAAVLGRVQEQPATGVRGALPGSGELSRGQQVGRRAGNGPQHAIQRRRALSPALLLCPGCSFLPRPTPLSWCDLEPGRRCWSLQEHVSPRSS
jgi:hypothetical protein